MCEPQYAFQIEYGAISRVFNIRGGWHGGGGYGGGGGWGYYGGGLAAGAILGGMLAAPYYYGGPGYYYGAGDCGWVRVRVLRRGHWVVRRAWRCW